MAFLNWSPHGYNEDAEVMQTAQRAQVFFGAALTPDFGIVGGINVMLVRGIGVAAGVGTLFAKGADAAEVGSAPAKADDAYKLAIARVVFVGITYNFSK
jgi:hypothetical protein